MQRFVLVVILVFCCTQLQAEVFYVPTVDKYITIQSAIDDANDGDIIVVSPDTYRENIDFLGKAITVRSTDPNDPNIVAVTVIDGNEPNDPNFASVVTFRSGETNLSVLTGFTITGGTGSWLPVSWEYKGLRWNRCGGGVLCYNMSEPTITNNLFVANSAGTGGGIYIYGDHVNPNDPSDPPLHITPIITDNTFVDNSALMEHGFTPPDTNYPNNDQGDGGAIVGFQGCDAIITGNRIENNNSYFYGGGIHLRQWSNGIIERNEIIGNDGRLGGGLHITYASSPIIKDNLIEYNQAGNFGGGGVYIYARSNPIVEKNIIRYNTSTRGAGIAVMSSSNPVVTTNLITDNYDGAGILCVGSESQIVYNTIVNNTPTWYPGGIRLESASPLIEHNIITSNGDGYGIEVADGFAPSQPTIRYNNIWGHSLGDYDPNIGDQTGVNGNISAPPVFTDAPGGDYHLDVSSPCINAGDPNYNVVPGEIDFEGDSRRLGQYVDIGADEAWPVWNTTKHTQYNAIQSAIDDANDADTIIVSQGRYLETISFGAHQIILRSLDPNDWSVVERTIIDANNVGTAVSIAGGQDANTVLTGFTITNGNATNGHAGGIWCYAAPIITKNIITQNYASYKGGGVYFWSAAAAAQLIDNRIVNNTANYAGAVYCDTSSRPHLEGNFIANNTAVRAAGAICYARNTGILQLTRNTIIANNAPVGGAVYLDSSPVTIMNNLLAGNSADYYGGAVLISYCDPNLINNTIVDNKAPLGAGIYSGALTAPFLANNIIAFSPQGHGIYAYDDPCRPANPVMLNNDVFANLDGNYAGAISDQTGLNGNISADPNFANPGYWDDANTPADANDDFYVFGNYHIPPDSNCVDAGDSNYLPPELAEDIDGEERIFEGTVDIGADEVVTNPLDFNVDGIIDYLELLLITDYWLQSGAELQGDLYDDDFIDMADFAVLAQQWGWKGPWYE